MSKNVELENSLRQKDSALADLASRLGTYEDLVSQRDTQCSSLTSHLDEMQTKWHIERTKICSENLKMIEGLSEKMKKQAITIEETNELNQALMKTIEAASRRESELSRKYETLLMKVKCYEKIVSGSSK
jgi:hypothetical protein